MTVSHQRILKSWFLTFHKPFFDALEENGNFVLNIKDKVVEGVRHRYVWNTIEALCENGWYSIEDYLWFKPNQCLANGLIGCVMVGNIVST